MKDSGKQNVVGVLIDGVDYDSAVERITSAAVEGRPYSVSALAVHGVMTGVGDAEHRYRLNHLDLVTPDGQPVKWALNLLHKAGLSDRVYGPTLMLKVCAEAARRDLPVYFYGSNQNVLDDLSRRLTQRFPGLVVAGGEPSKFRPTSQEEKQDIAARIRSSGARLAFVGLGCPRQETFAYEYRDALGMPVIAVGAAFDYHAGHMEEPPMWIQERGLQWLHRLLQDPARLWKRYLLLNPAYLTLLALQALGLWKPDPERVVRPAHEMLYG
jgi:N-acetylglucosaminyldiphosphoundecaprenol N-acetyl-beta-D-mannosaminyltransferase